MNKLVIEKGVAIPPKASKGGKWIDTVRKMTVADSILVPSLVEYHHVYMAAERAGVKIITRKDEKGGQRIWRIA